MTILATAPVVGIERTKINSIVFASALGTIIEW
jgi:MHS family shikimate/dehydroshikimate transporter-like MFS transporter